MASLKQYFETDFSNTIRVNVSFVHDGNEYQGSVLYDPVAYTAFSAWYIPGSLRTHDEFLEILQALRHGETKLNLRDSIVLPSAKMFPGQLKFERNEQLDIWYQLIGDYTWRHAQKIPGSGRIFFYAETQLTPDEVSQLQDAAKEDRHHLLFRSAEYVQYRTEVPLAFISHDWRDKDTIARPVATSLQNKLCPVWYDEFSLNVGDRLRESIGKGLKECKKCVLVLSPNFLSNNGWTKAEFNSIFTREILEGSSLVLPVWYKVTKEEVYEYSPNLLNIKGLDWEKLGEEEVCRKLYRVISSD